MEKPDRGKKVVILSALILFALIYSAWLISLHSWTGARRVDGMIGVLFGLYICSHPSANFLDLLIYRHSSLNQDLAGRPLALWLTLNLVTFLVGWGVFVIGTTQFTGG